MYQSFLKFGRIIIFAFQRFYSEKRLLWAASLTFTTIFSLIPLLSVLFFVFNVFGDLSQLKLLIQPYIYKTLAPGAQETVLNMINNLVESINFGTIGVFSSTILIISVFLLLFEIEYALNEIWLIRQKISIASRAAVYWAALTVGPLILAVSLFIIVTLQSYNLVRNIELFIKPDIFSYLSYVLIWIAFTGIYFFMPSTKVKLSSAVLGGVIAGTFWKAGSFMFSIYTSKFLFYYPKVYGSLAAIPMFLLWIFLCWILFLLGAEITYLHQNSAFYVQSYKLPALNLQNKLYYTLLIMFFIGKRFISDQKAPTLPMIAYSLHIPVFLVRELMEPLLKNGILVESRYKGSCFIPGRPLSRITLSEIIEKVKQKDVLNITFYNSNEDTLCKKIISESMDMYKNKSIQELLT